MDSINFDLGERKQVILEIRSRKNEEFEIYDASYSLLRRYEDKEEASGLCDIFQNELNMIISPKQEGAYTLRVTYHIGEEILIENVGIQVRK